MDAMDIRCRTGLSVGSLVPIVKIFRILRTNEKSIFTKIHNTELFSNDSIN